jgi:uncharacterized protein DUF551
MTWQPIETAPKDGTVLLLYGGEDDNAGHVGEKYQTFCRSPCRGMWDGNEWLMALAEAGYVGVCRNNPTHWMPLPEPPQ